MTYQIYLSGPIEGITKKESTEWRQQVADELEDNYDVECLDPMRDVHADDDTVIQNVGLMGNYENPDTVTSIDPSMLTDRGIITRDHNDTVRADMLIVNLLGAKPNRIGTVCEMAWAWDRQIPIVLIMENEGNVCDHPFVREMARWRVDTIERALNVVKSALGLRPFWSIS